MGSEFERQRWVGQVWAAQRRPIVERRGGEARTVEEWLNAVWAARDRTLSSLAGGSVRDETAAGEDWGIGSAGGESADQQATADHEAHEETAQGSRAGGAQESRQSSQAETQTHDYRAGES